MNERQVHDDYDRLCHRKPRAPTEESWVRSVILILILSLALAVLAILVDRCV